MRPSSDCPPDEALKLLIKHKNQVTSGDEEKIDLSVVTGTLEKDDELLENLGLIMERKDREMRMPPYRHIYSGEKLGKYTVGESFVGDLREIEREELSEQLNSEDGDVRLKAAGSHICEGRGPNGEEKGETGRRECIAFDPSP